MMINEMEKYLEEASGMDLDGLVDRLREQHKEMCNKLTAFDEEVTGLYEPGGSLSNVRGVLLALQDHLWLAYSLIALYQEESHDVGRTHKK